MRSAPSRDCKGSTVAGSDGAVALEDFRAIASGFVSLPFSIVFFSSSLDLFSLSFLFCCLDFYTRKEGRSVTVIAARSRPDSKPLGLLRPGLLLRARYE